MDTTESMPADLSEALKLATKESHELAESSEFMRNFQKGQVTRDQFTLLLDSLYFIYTALEEESERNKDHPAFAPVYFPSELDRKEALERDLEYFHGPEWRSHIKCPKATGKYVSRIQQVGRSEPELLVAHAYIRYLGDLSGGQVLKKVAQKALQLPSTGEGIAFFSFDRITNATKFKQLYRSRMNTLEAHGETRQRILEEANRAFQLNVEVFNELLQLGTQNQRNSDLMNGSMLGDLSEALKLATKESHELAENSEFMKNFQKGQVTRDQFMLLLDSLYFIYTALEEESERNKDHPAFAPVYFPSELDRKEALERDLEYFHGPEWRSHIKCPKATGKYVSRIQQVGRSEPELLVAHAYIRYLGDLSGGQVLKKVAQKALQLPSTGEGIAFFSFDRITNATKFKQLYRSRMNTLEAHGETRQRILEEANRAFQLNVEVFNELLQLGTQNQRNSDLMNGSMLGDLSEALKLATKESHELAENSEFMKNFQKGQVTRDQFMLLLDSLYFIYTALEEESERNKDHPAFAPVYFPSELDRKEALERDLEYFHGPEWRSHIKCPKATGKYVSRIQQVGRSEPELLVAHAYIRYLGDLSGGQVLKKVAQKALQLPSTGEGIAFFSFDRITNATKFKQLYRSRMNTLEAHGETRQRILEEANRAFQLNVEVFNELQRLSSESERNGTVYRSEIRKRAVVQERSMHTGATQDLPLQPRDSLTNSPGLRFALLFGLVVVSLGIGWYLL
ncbi:heme oxygenase 1a isoform X2 [Pristis pectinata]|uniref:heme oxygenase 1a isoform X1 n=1 Tax=Pristis pectinata TaxID=685728 RepID=UPI00223D3586|nr:heme oxygenase 1a isoform X1 [Pristis pectinata]XP_051899100.1 heme oxygenase 1a isoform X2 [Pristis pectinata]